MSASSSTISTPASSVDPNDPIASVKASYPTINMTDNDAKKFISQRANWFKTSIAICCIYGFFALVLLLLAIFSPQGKLILSGPLMPFTVTLIGGILFIVLLLIIQVTSFKPSITDANVYDGDICPDYWTLKKLSDTDLNNLGTYGVDQKNKYLMGYKCVPNKDVYANDDTKNASATGATNVVSNATNANVYGQYKDSNNRYYVNNPTNLSKTKSPVTTYLYTNFAKLNDGGTNLTSADYTSTDSSNGDQVKNGDTGAKLYCDVVYPNLLAMQDQVNFPNAPNSLRCAYAKQCGIPWTGVCPNLPTDNL